MITRILLKIKPETWFKVLPEHTMYFAIHAKNNYSFECQRGRKYKGKRIGCNKWRKEGNCNHVLQQYGRRVLERIEQYNRYKINVLALAKKEKFQLPQYGWALYFYFPVPTSWTKKQKIAYHGQPRIIKPDIDNLDKAFFDSLSVTDEKVAQLSGNGKFWFNPDLIEDKSLAQGYIEIILNQVVYNPYNVIFIDQKAFESQPKRKWVKREKTQEQLFKKVDKIV